jgi:hypothetical protein
VMSPPTCGRSAPSTFSSARATTASSGTSSRFGARLIRASK